jgi:hypothetical protein
MVGKFAAAIGVASIACSVPAFAAPQSDQYRSGTGLNGVAECKFRSVPDLVLTAERGKDVVAAMLTKRAPQGTASLTLMFEPSPGNVVDADNFHGVFVTSSHIDIVDDRFATNKMVRAEIAVDGRRMTAPTHVEHKPKPLTRTVFLVPQNMGPEWLAQLAGGSSASVTLFDQAGRSFGPWTFDVSGLRAVPQRLIGAKWICG